MISCSICLSDLTSPDIPASSNQPSREPEPATLRLTAPELGTAPGSGDWEKMMQNLIDRVDPSKRFQMDEFAY
jgi:hypothetical protein